MTKAIFLDRDGIINDLIMHKDKLTAPWSINEFHINNIIKNIILKIKNLGYKVFVISNQPDVLDGNLRLCDLEKMCTIIKDDLDVDEIICALDRSSEYYKPNNLMIEELINKYNIDRSKSFIIGESWKDMICGNNSNLVTIYIGEKYISPIETDIVPDHIVSNIKEAYKIIENNYGE